MRYSGTSNWHRITDEQYIDGLRKGDEQITKMFFYGLCSFTLNDIRLSLMHGAVDYDELTNELYLFLSADGWRRLDTFARVNGCSLRTWLSRVAWRFFMRQRGRLLGIGGVDTDTLPVADTADTLEVEIAMDVQATLTLMKNKRYVQVLNWMLFEGYEAEEVAVRLNTGVANVYNIKHRAIVQFIENYNEMRKLAV